MHMRTLLAAAAASSLIASPALANSAAPLSVSNATSVKASTSVKKANKLGGEAGAGVIAALIVAIPIVAAVANDEDSDSN